MAKRRTLFSRFRDLSLFLLDKRVKMIIRDHENLKTRTTFGVPATCRYWVEGDDEEEILAFVSDHALGLDEVFVLGGGSNVLFTTDFPGVIFHPVMRDLVVTDESATELFVRVGAGLPWDDLVAWSVEHELYGLENLSRIPGHVGAAPVQNIGAYGMEAGERIVRVEAIDIARGERRVIDGRACRFGYRDSIFKHELKNRFIITGVTFRLSKVPCFCVDYKGVREELERLGEPTLARVREAITRLREARLPDVKQLPNAGSFFKNPVVEASLADQLAGKYPDMPRYPFDGGVKLAAAWLIERAGWKGRSLGEAAVHDKQALVLVNKGAASGEAIARLANEVRKAVFLHFGVWIEPEVNIL
jgi:UDP-N-acetylmuramate dehydrogenase